MCANDEDGKGSCACQIFILDSENGDSGPSEEPTPSVDDLEKLYRR